MTAEDVIRHLALKPHPEGGYYRETFRDQRSVEGARAASTAIYFLLTAGQVSKWHRVDAVEIWHWYAGAALELAAKRTLDSKPDMARLGPRLDQGELPQAIVAQSYWQQARSLGAWTLVGCTVAPGFTFDGFETAP